MRNGLRAIGFTLATLAAMFVILGSKLAGEPAKPLEPQQIHVDSLNNGGVVLIGKLGFPLGTYHDVQGTFGVPNAKGRSGQGGEIYLHVLEIDGIPMKNPIWIPYYKGMSLETYKLADGTSIFPQHPHTHVLDGRSVRCKVYEDILFRNTGGDVTEHYGNTSKNGFDNPRYETALGVLYVFK